MAMAGISTTQAGPLRPFCCSSSGLWLATSPVSSFHRSHHHRHFSTCGSDRKDVHPLQSYNAHCSGVPYRPVVMKDAMYLYMISSTNQAYCCGLFSSSKLELSSKFTENNLLMGGTSNSRNGVPISIPWIQEALRYKAQKISRGHLKLAEEDGTLQDGRLFEGDGALQNVSSYDERIKYSVSSASGHKRDGIASSRINLHSTNAIHRQAEFTEQAVGKPSHFDVTRKYHPQLNGSPAQKISGNDGIHPPEIPGVPDDPVQRGTVINEDLPKKYDKSSDKTCDELTSSSGELDSQMQVHRDSLARLYDKVLVIDKISVAKKVVHMLTTKYRALIHACDTEVAKIDVKQETPVGHGEIVCFSIYSGKNADFGNGKTCIWVDVLDGERSILMEFAPFFEDPSIKKVWHNYSFDSHVIENYGIKLSGFHADTMHLARLWDSSRKTDGGYSLEALTSNPTVMSGVKSATDSELTIGKTSMKSVFGKKKVKKDGTEGKLISIAPVETLQREERIPWICYSALDSISTLKLFESLKKKLMAMRWVLNDCVQEERSMYDFYQEYWRPFGELLVQMESEGMFVDRAYLAEIEKVAIAEQKVAADRFRKWASKYCPEAKYMNVGSDAQIRQLFFGGVLNRNDQNEFLPWSKTFKVPNIGKVVEAGKKSPSKYLNITLKKIGGEMETEMYTASGWPSMSGAALKAFAGKVSADQFYFTDDGHDFMFEGTKGISSDRTLPEEDKMEGCDMDTSAYGTAYSAFGKNKEGIEACHAIAALCEVCSIDSLISNFILPLQGSHISGRSGRIHCSLNINTETGRLSARRPNLQNQPALEKDRYKIRQAFIAAPGNSLIVADYGQLELRILAHLANCKSMLDAFRAGGDFHSRTAMNMYKHVRDAVEKNEVLLEWQPQPGEDKPPVPLLKDAFASERRKAKMLNFSIAYGKTPVGLSRDLKVSVKEARETVKLWYQERQEVLRWQKKRKNEAQERQCVHTLLGRARRFPSTAHASNGQRGHIERAAINTPVQGSAADVAMCAMLQIAKNERLKELKWKLLLQVHDEVILEGPTESAEEARDIVVECMSKPFNGENLLRVDLSVDAKFAQSWYAAK